jgi:hypothetical protein
MRTSGTLRRLIGPLELIHEQAGPRLRRLTRLGVFGLWLAKLLLDPLWRLAALPHALYRPVGLIGLLGPRQIDALLSPTVLTALWIATVAAIIFALTDVAFATASTLAAFFLTLYSSTIRGFGPAVHTDIVLLLAVYALALFAWADFFSPRRDRHDHRAAYPLVTIVALLSLSYCLVGVNRLIGGGLEVFTGDSMRVWSIDASLRGYYFDTGVGWHVAERPWLAFMMQAGFPAVTLFEITAPLVLAWPRYRWIFIPFMLAFHLLSLVVMNIFFFDDMLLYLLLIDWSRRYPELRR